MIERHTKLRKKSDALATELLELLCSPEPGETPSIFAPLVNDLRSLSARMEGKRMGLETLEPELEKSREYDERIDGLEGQLREARAALVGLSAPLARAVLQAMRREEVPVNEAFQPLMDATAHMVDLKRSIDGVTAGEGFWARGKARAEKLLHQGRLKVAQVKRHAGLKKAGKGILKNRAEESFRCDATAEVLEQVSIARHGLETLRKNLKGQRLGHAKRLNQAAQRLGVGELESTDALESLKKEWQADLEEHRRLRELSAEGILARAADPATPAVGISLIADYRAARTALDESCRACVEGLENVDWETLRAVLGDSRGRCPETLKYLRGIPAFDAVVSRGNRELGLESCGGGLALCLLKVKCDPFVGLPDKAIVSIELEDMEQIYERRQGNVVADSLIGFVTGGVKGAFIRGASGMRGKEAPVDMPDLVATITRRDAEGKDSAIHLAVGFDDREAVAAFLEAQFGDRFRLAAKARRSKSKSRK